MFKVNYTFPNVEITGTQMSCGLQPVKLYNGITYYGTYPNMLFGMCFFSKFPKLHSKYAPGNGSWWIEDLGGKGLMAGDNLTNKRYHTIDPKYGYLMSASTTVLDEIEKTIKDWDLGVTYRTPNFKNKKYGAYGTTIGVLVWHWNGKVPALSLTTLKDFPYDDNGDKVIKDDQKAA